ncbi:tumor necrosis factor receptor-associated factor 6-like protein [Reticulomyxa filosa]|uniref:Tumor necrosis factor receptor-associated factor 6-like protein n=1 Tax=Reticulomyxa filosa TaxID=46433 RepID=X6PFB6_RETFI|nr:tumor necrosis factor receptor-associated factor 6-like protein [Reticulomyxa filosa]|eukprot:ETO36808.1 tumor necrosis factor receptor-associated factor 6-like protein [Reticulomyxa filosa]
MKLLINNFCFFCEKFQYFYVSCYLLIKCWNIRRLLELVFTRVSYNKIVIKKKIMPEEVLESGYDSEDFVEEDHDKASKFRCAICTCIAREPTETQPCGHLFCKDCLSSYLSHNQSVCPNCRSEIQSKNASGFIKREILQLRVKCNNRESGCEWIGELNNCTFCKKVEYVRKDEAKHWEECEEYPIDCKCCNQKVLRKQTEAHLRDECTDAPIACPNKGCTNDKILRKHIPQHLQKCAMSVAACPFEGFGCVIAKGSLLRKELKDHLSTHCWAHCVLKQAYLERLIFSTELLRINSDELSGRISGIYERQWKQPYDGRPSYRHRTSERDTLIRFDAQNKRWIVTCENQVLAQRYGLFPTPIAEEEEDQSSPFPLELEYEQGLPDEKQNNDKEAKVVGHLCRWKGGGSFFLFFFYQKKIICAFIYYNKYTYQEKNINQDDEKAAEKQKQDPKSWHVVGGEKYKIKLLGCTQREIDLEWKVLQMAVKQFEDDMDTENEAIGSGVLCKCGTELVETTITQQYANNTIVACDICHSQISLHQGYLHCPTNFNSQHSQGFDLCHSCGEARSQTQHINKRIVCDCGQEMAAFLTQKCYPTSNVMCNKCFESIPKSKAVFHCPAGKSKEHSMGQDICIKCAEASVSSYSFKRMWPF